LEVEETDRPEQLVPIRLDFDVEHHKMKDTFVWNLNGEWLKRMRRCNNLLFGPAARFFGCVRARNLFFHRHRYYHHRHRSDPVVTPETFAQSIVDDYGLAPAYHSVIVKSIQEQLSDYKAHSFNYDQDTGELVVDLRSEVPMQQGHLDDDQEKWWEMWKTRINGPKRTIRSMSRGLRKKRRLDFNNPSHNGLSVSGGAVVKVEEEEKNSVTFDVSMDEEEFGRPMGIDEIKLDEELMHEEMRILIKVRLYYWTFDVVSC